jgi:hypothetical protein
MDDCYLVHPDVVVVTKIQELLPSELSAVLGDDRIGDPKQKIMSWTKLTACLEPILAMGLESIQLVNLMTVTSRWFKPPALF